MATHRAPNLAGGTGRIRDVSGPSRAQLGRFTARNGPPAPITAGKNGRKNRENGGRTKFDREFHFTHTPSRRAGAHLPRHLAAMQNGVRRPARDDVAVPLAPEPSLRRRRGGCHRGGHRSGIQPPPTRPSRGLGGHRGAATRAPAVAELLPSRSVDCMYPFTLYDGC